VYVDGCAGVAKPGQRRRTEAPVPKGFEIKRKLLTKRFKMSEKLRKIPPPAPTNPHSRLDLLQNTFVETA